MNPLLKLNIRILIAVFLVFTAIALFYKENINSEIVTAKATPTVLSSPSPKTNIQKNTPLPKQESTATPAPTNNLDVSAHNTPTDCWIIIDGNTYNITSYFGRHPGGDGYLAKYCGMDASIGFNTKDSFPARVHSAAAKLLLRNYLVK